MPSNLDFLLRYSFQKKDKNLQDYVINSLVKIANGGIYDHIGGGFSRYSVDEKWHIPHFEKMLYDNAQLVSLYSKAYQLTKNETFKTVVTETLDFVERELIEENNAFYSSLDADSATKNGDLEEGIYYAWTKEELKTLLQDDFELFKAYYNINAIGKWEKNTYVLYKTKTAEEFCKTMNLNISEFDAKVSLWKIKLLEARSLKQKPRKDSKSLTSWNALMLKAYADAYRVFDNKQYLDKAIKNATFIKEHQMDKDGALLHNFINGESSIAGFSEDYAHTIDAFMALYQVTLDESWLYSAKTLIDYSIAHFLDKESGMFYFTSDTEANLITRKIDVIDNVIPSSNSVLALNLFKLGHYYSDKAYSKMAKQMLSNMKTAIKKSPSGYSNWHNLYLNFSNPYFEVAISGTNAHEKLKELNKHYLPNILIVGATKESKMPLLDYKFNPNETYIYVCTNGTCKFPVTKTSKAIEQLLK